MAVYKVIFEGTIREVYFVEADSKDEAMENWADFEPDISEVMDGAPVSAELVDDED